MLSSASISDQARSVNLWSVVFEACEVVLTSIIPHHDLQDRPYSLRADTTGSIGRTGAMEVIVVSALAGLGASLGHGPGLEIAPQAAD
jgi:hypothetical protein